MPDFAMQPYDGCPIGFHKNESGVCVPYSGTASTTVNTNPTQPKHSAFDWVTLGVGALGAIGGTVGAIKGGGGGGNNSSPAPTPEPTPPATTDNKMLTYGLIALGVVVAVGIGFYVWKSMRKQ